MAENNQLKAGQLIPDSQGGSSGLDHMFNGLGLDSYIGKKDTGITPDYTCLLILFGLAS